MEFNKLAVLSLTGNIHENYKCFKAEVKIYLTATETSKKSREVARLKNLMGPEALRLLLIYTIILQL